MDNVLGIIVSAVCWYLGIWVLSPITIMQRGIIFGFGAGISVIVAIFLVLTYLGLKTVGVDIFVPLGATYSLIGKKSIIRVDHNHEELYWTVWSVK